VDNPTTINAATALLHACAENNPKAAGYFERLKAALRDSKKLMALDREIVQQHTSGK